MYEVSICLKDKVGKEPGNYPETIQTEWLEFFSESIFGTVLPLYLKYYSKLILIHKYWVSGRYVDVTLSVYMDVGLKRILVIYSNIWENLVELYSNI